MKFLSYLSEEWVISTKNFNRVVDIFVNPSSSKEFKDMEEQSWGGQVRFIADFKKKKLYVWSSELIHYDATRELAHQNLLQHDHMEKLLNYCCFGIGIILGKKIVFEEFYDGATQKQLKNKAWRRKDDKWLSKWFTEPFLKTAEKLITELP